MYFNPRSLSLSLSHEISLREETNTHIDDEIWLGAQLGLFTNIDLPPSPDKRHLPTLANELTKDASHLKFFQRKIAY
jgi:hypothetical protein